MVHIIIALYLKKILFIKIIVLTPAVYIYIYKGVSAA